MFSKIVSVLILGLALPPSPFTLAQEEYAPAVQEIRRNRLRSSGVFGPSPGNVNYTPDSLPDSAGFRGAVRKLQVALDQSPDKPDSPDSPDHESPDHNSPNDSPDHSSSDDRELLAANDRESPVHRDRSPDSSPDSPDSQDTSPDSPDRRSSPSGDN